MKHLFKSLSLAMSLFLVCINLSWAQDEPAAPVKPQGTLAELVTALENSDSINNEVTNITEQARQLSELHSHLENHEKLLRDILADVPDANFGAVSNAQLLDLQTQVLNDSNELGKNINRLNAGMTAMEKLLAKLHDEKVQWVARIELAKQLDAPADFVQRLVHAQNEVNGLLQKVRPQRDKLLDLLERATNLRSKSNSLNNELNTRRSRLNHELRESEGEPLWVLFTRPALNAQAVEAERNAQWLSIVSYVHSNTNQLLLLIVLLFVGTFTAMSKLRIGLDDDHAGVLMLATRRVVKHHRVAAFLLGLLGVIIFSPSSPSAVDGLLWLFVPIPAAILFQAAIGRSARFTVWALVAALLLLQFRILLELTPWLDRLVMCGQVIFISAALLIDLRRMHRTPLAARSPAIYAVVGVLVLTLLAAFYANLVGYVGLARTLRTGVVGSMGFAMLYVAVFQVLFGLGVSLTRSSFGRLSLMVQKNREAIEKLLYSLLRFLAVVGWGLASLTAFGVSEQLPNVADTMMTTSIAVGAAHISTGSLITAALCLLATYMVLKLFRALLEDEILPRLRISQGVSYAVSMLSRYIVAIIGFLFTLSAAGIDLSKMTILAGAVGVGIGFGLQNIVNNFISGLILLIEQPIHVGDLVETSSSIGIVKRIGIRASTITTSHGADVIVPNGQLLTLDLLNWTRSSRSRRIDILIGVAYGSDPVQVQHLLVDAIKDHPMIRSTPDPVAFFMGFGDSALDFRVQVWVTDAMEATKISSELRNRILMSLNEQGIAIPFPQRDLWLRNPEQTASFVNPKPTPEAPTSDSNAEPAPVVTRL